MVKLIIWDLDGVFWKGSVTEGGDTTLNQDIIKFIKNTEANGIIHSICSKNSFNYIKQRLQKLEIWDLFVFPSINHEPKSARISQIINDCQLRSADVVFVDDNIINLNEAKFYLPDLSTYSDPYEFINSFIIPKGSSKTNQYRILETKSETKKQYDSNIDFLKDSDIHIALVKNYDCLLYHKRIEELVNRSNQLNYTKSRFMNTTAEQHILQNNIMSHAIFAWDKYGYYGLIGYMSVKIKGNYILNSSNLINFVFSCRVMNMNIDQKCLQILKQHYKSVIGANQIDQVDHDIDYITVHDYNDVENFIRQKENLTKNDYSIAFLMNCISSAYAVYSKHIDKIYYNVPLEKLFRTDKLYHGEMTLDDMPKIIVFAAYIEFIFNYSVYWEIEQNQTKEYFDSVITHFVNQLSSTGRNALILLPKYSRIFDQDKRYGYLYDAWSKHMKNNNITILFMPEEDKDVNNDTHPINQTPVNELPPLRRYSRHTIHKITTEIDKWLDKQLRKSGI